MTDWPAGASQCSVQDVHTIGSLFILNDSFMYVYVCMYDASKLSDTNSLSNILPPRQRHWWMHRTRPFPPAAGWGCFLSHHCLRGNRYTDTYIEVIRMVPMHLARCCYVSIILWSTFIILCATHLRLRLGLAAGRRHLFRRWRLCMAHSLGLRWKDLAYTYIQNR